MDQMTLTYLTVVNDRMRKHEKLEDNEILFNTIEEEETRMKAEQKASANFASLSLSGFIILFFLSILSHLDV